MIAVPSKEEVRIPNDTLDQRGGSKPNACDRLDSWKEIAAYLRRSIRCVQRWERTEGLPVLRHWHANGATVYAYRHEVDNWWQGGKTNAHKSARASGNLQTLRRGTIRSTDEAAGGEDVVRVEGGLETGQQSDFAAD